MRLFLLSAVSAAVGLGAAGASAVALPDLAAYQGVRRVLVIDQPSGNDPAFRAQLAAFEAVAAELAERDVEIVRVPGAPVFRVRLVGKDGGVKLDSAEPVAAAEVFALIDAMPMRRAEVAERAAARKDAAATREP
jgi:hypothetical protein